jgi:hypothetical protein
LRYAPELVEYTKNAPHGKVLGVFSYGPAPLDEKQRNPGLFHYGIHAVEVLVRGIRAGKADYGVVAFAQNGVQTVTIGTKYIYRELLKKIVDMFQTGKSPLDIAVTLEMMAFMESALKSGMNHGAGEKLTP